ncbi:MAG: SLBB domain-containing protein [Odoribacter splanchnicus]
MKKLFLLILFVQFISVTFAQMSDDQVVAMVKEAQNQGKTQQQIIMMLGQKGVTQEQLIRIKNNYSNKKNSAIGQTGNGMSRLRQDNSPAVNMLDSLNFEGNKALLHRRNSLPRTRIFGRNIFNNKQLTFEPNLNIATPENYVLGPGDEIIVDIWGGSVKTIRQYIAPDGNITIEEIGPIYLNGLKIEEAYQRVKNALSQVYASLNSEQPDTFIKLSLGNVRSIRVNVMGEVAMPGTYTLPSLATLFHALYNAGGVGKIGSMRNITVNRKGKVIAEVDVYDYLLKGRSDLDISLNDGDVVLVAPYANLVSLSGKVKRPMIYEMKDTETVGDLLEYAGGFKGDAYKNAIRVIRKSGREYQVYNVEEGEFGSFPLADGDSISVDPMLNRFENRVQIRGAVYRPGLYDLAKVTTVKELIEKAEGVTEDAFVNRAVLFRQKPDLSQEVIALNITGILSGSAASVPLQKNDELYIPSIFDLQEEYTLSVKGAVRVPGVYKYADNATIEDLIIQAGGLLESASTVKIDVARRIKNPKSLTGATKLAENFTFTLKDGLIVDGKPDFTLEPYDEVFVRNSPGYQVQQNVSVTGEVLFEGSYVLSQKGERLSDLVKRAGGLMPEAYAKGARLLRQMTPDEKARVESVLKLSKQTDKDSIDINRLDIGNTYYVGIELRKAIENPGSDYDIVLREGDRLIVPQYTGTVKISGAVMYPNTVVYKKNAKLNYYIEQGGGFASRAKKHKVFIVYMNGTVQKSKTFSKAKAAPGCEIIVPVKPPRKGVGLAEIMSIASSTTSMAALVTSIINSTK